MVSLGGVKYTLQSVATDGLPLPWGLCKYTLWQLIVSSISNCTVL